MRLKVLLAVLLVFTVLSPIAVARAGFVLPSNITITDENRELIQQLLTLLASLQKQLKELQEDQSSSSSESSTKTSVSPLTVTYPNSGGIFSEGESINVGWMPTGPLSGGKGVATIELISMGSGEDFVLYSKKVFDYDVNYSGSFLITLPKITESDGSEKYKIRITAPDGETDMSNKSFTVNAKG